MESFFSPLQKNVPDTRRRETREELRLAIARETVFKARPKSPLTGYARRDRLSEIHVRLSGECERASRLSTTYW
jgi:hypothetical protein